MSDETATGTATVDATSGADPGDVRLRVDGLSKRYGGIHAVSEVSFELPVGEIRGIIGPNGAGKTTLFDMIAGAQRPTEGVLTLDGRVITRSSAVKRARLGVRRTFQRQQPIGWLTVEDNVLAALEWRNGGGGVFGDLVAAPSRRKVERGRRAEVEEILELCGLGESRDRQAAELSIGEARRLELARAVVDKPSLLLLDEPTSGLEDADLEVFAQIVRDLRDSTSCSVLIIEHDVPFVMSFCQQIMVMDLGKLIVTGTPAEVSAHPAVREAYLGAQPGD